VTTLDENDRTLIQRVALRDEAAFRQLHARYEPRITRFVFKATKRVDRVEEITSETLWTVWNRAASFRSGSKVSTWIFGIAHHLTLRSIRDVARELPVTESDLPNTTHLYEPLNGTETVEWLMWALAQLNPQQRAVLELAYLSGQSCEEIALRHDCSVNTVKTRLFYGRNKLRRLFSQC
jgi:RNA polymerase sigma-70 factor, ECF subfamily